MHAQTWASYCAVYRLCSLSHAAAAVRSRTKRCSCTLQIIFELMCDNPFKNRGYHRKLQIALYDNSVMKASLNVDGN